MNGERLAAILDRLDEEQVAAGEFLYRIPSCKVTVDQPGDAGQIIYAVPTRRLAANALRFLHGGFLYPQSRCTVELITRQGSWENVPGAISECRHVAGGIHDVHVTFDEKIDVGLYCAEAMQLHVLLVEDHPLFRKIGRTLLARLNATVEEAVNGREAIDMAGRNAYDLILIDIEMPEMDGLEATRRLRAQGYRGRIVAVTGRGRDEDRLACLDAGVDDYVCKPFGVDALKAQIEQLHEEPLVSSMSGDADVAALIDDFIKELPARLRHIEDALRSQDFSALEALCRQLKSEAGGLGFEPILESARTIEDAAQRRADHDNLQREVGNLGRWCRRARA